MRDPVTSNVPNEAFSWPDELRVRVGPLSLTTNHEIEAANSLLKRVDLGQILRNIRRDNRKQRIQDPEQVPGDRPVTISLIGLKDQENTHRAFDLKAHVVDPECVLRELITAVRRIFVDAKFLKPQRDRFDRLEKVDIADRPLLVSILKTNYLRSKEVNHTLTALAPERKVIYKQLGIDVARIYSKYKEHVWASSFDLEKRSILELGLHEFMRGPLQVGRGNREIVSVPLPGVSPTHLKPEFQDITYKRLGNQFGFHPDAVYDVTSR